MKPSRTTPATEDSRLAALMRAAQDGDSGAYAELLRLVAPRIRNAVRRHRPFLGSHDIEDLVQDVLLSLHAVRATYDPQRPFMPWILAIVRHRLVDGARRYGRREAHELRLDDLSVTFIEQRTKAEDEAYRDPEELKHAIQALPRGQREAIEMLKLREMSLKEAAAATGTSVGALKVSVHRAMAALRKALSKE